MISTIFLLVIVGVVIAAFYTAEKDLLRAVKCDLQNRYKEAIYYYAVGSVSSCFFKDNCRAHIAHLWEKYGPFDYSGLYNSTADIKDRESFISREAIIEIIKNSIVSS